jgi:hypothetical protein
LTRIKRDRDTQKELNMEYIIQVKEKTSRTPSFYLKNYILMDGYYEIVGSKEHALILSYKKAVDLCFWLNNHKKAIDYAVMVEFA